MMMMTTLQYVYFASVIWINSNNNDNRLTVEELTLMYNCVVENWVVAREGTTHDSGFC